MIGWRSEAHDSTSAEAVLVVVATPYLALATRVQSSDPGDRASIKRFEGAAIGASDRRGVPRLRTTTIS